MSPSRNLVSGSSLPPVGFTVARPPLAARPTRIVPPAPQLAPPPALASQTTFTAFPRKSYVFSFPSAKKAIFRESGDQNGRTAPSVPASRWNEADASGRIQSVLRPPCSSL